MQPDLMKHLLTIESFAYSKGAGAHVWEAIKAAKDIVANASPPKRESIGRFGHHPNPAIDFCVEVDCLEGLARNACCGMDDFDEVCDRVFIAMMFRVGGDEGAVKAKQRLRELEKMLMENRPTTQIEGGE